MIFLADVQYNMSPYKLHILFYNDLSVILKETIIIQHSQVARFEILIAVLMKTPVFWDMMPYRLSLFGLPRGCRQNSALRHCDIYTNLHAVIFQKTGLFYETFILSSP